MLMDECTQVIATLIYTASTLHAAVNFPQGPFMSFNPSCPGSVYEPPPHRQGNKPMAR